jgi:ferredoxin-type protein NapG
METTTRRSFCVGAVAAAGLVAVGGLATALGSEELLRLPGAGTEEQFKSLCIKCDRCRSICPRGCVSLGTLEQGWENARIPTMDYHQGYCDFCGRCAEVCPSGALLAFSASDYEDSLRKLGVATVDADECLAWSGGGCQVCVSSCPYQAISLDNSERPIVDATRCNGCGCCEFVCPSSSYRSYSGSKLRGINVSVREDGE